MQLSEHEQRHCQRVKRYILQQIAKQGGAISFADYMQIALYQSGLGYYVSGKTKFGKQGDFVTAPEISAIFSQCVANYCLPVLQETQGDVLEFGAGSGIMAADMLLYWQSQKQLPTRYFILEPSADLQALQQQTLRDKCPDLLQQVVWLRQLPTQFSGVIVANEVVDAMPVELFQIQEKQIKRAMVVEQQGELAINYQHSDDIDFLSAVAHIPCQQLSNGYTSEVNTLVKPWLASIKDCLVKGAMLIIDYGFPRQDYYMPQRDAGTLMCHFHHHAHSQALWAPGIQDITAHVDFTSIAEASLEQGWQLEGFTNQASFLIKAGLAAIYQQHINADARTTLDLSQQIRQLTQPHEMGELVKVMVLSQAIENNHLGFAADDQCQRL